MSRRPKFTRHYWQDTERGSRGLNNFSETNNKSLTDEEDVPCVLDLYINTQKGKVNRSMLLDTGASQSIMKKSQVPRENLLTPAKVKLVGVTGNTIHTEGKTQLKFNLNGEEFVEDVVVVPDYYLGNEIDGIFSRRMMRRQEIVFEKGFEHILHKQHRIKIRIHRTKNSIAPIYSNCSELETAERKRTCHQVLNKQKVTIPSGVVTPIRAKLPEKCTGTFILKTQNLVKTGFVAIPALYHLNNDDEVNAFIVNSDDNEKLLSANVKLGQLVEIKEDDVTYQEEASEEMLAAIKKFDNLDGGERKLRLETIFRDLKTDHMTADQREKIKTLVEKYQDIFFVDDFDVMECTNLVKANIELEDPSAIVYQRPYTVPIALRDELKAELEKLEKQGIIEPADPRSPHNLPLIAIRKPSGGLRIILDTRILNSLTKKSCMVTIQKIQDISHESALLTPGKKLFSKCDLSQGFFNVELEPKARNLVSFDSPAGRKRFRTLVQGFRDSPFLFSQIMSQIVSDEFRQTGYEPLVDWESESLTEAAKVYLDDVLLCTKDDETQHLRKIEELFRRLQFAKMRLSAKKCLFFLKKVTFLGHVLNQDGISVDQEKVSKIRLLQPPKTKKDVRSLVGNFMYFSNHVKNFAELAAPITDLLKGKNNKVVWTQQCQENFEKIKKQLEENVMLYFPSTDPEGTMILYTDASLKATGWCLMQKQTRNGVRQEYPLLFGGKKLSVTQSRYAVHRLELLAVVQALKETSYLISGRKIILRTDSMSLVYMLNAKNLPAVLHRYLETLLSFDMEIEHVAGTQNPADFFSRIVIENGVASYVDKETNKHMSFEEFWERVRTVKLEKKSILANFEKELVNKMINVEDIKRGQAQDKTLAEIIKKLSKGKCSNFQLGKSGLLYNTIAGRQRIVIPPKMEKDVFDSIHFSKFTYHIGQKKMQDCLNEIGFFIKRLKLKLNRYVAQCNTCNVAKIGKKNKFSLGKYKIVDRAWHTVHVDFGSVGTRNLLVLVDRYSGWTEAEICKDQTAESVIKVLERKIFCRYGVIDTLISDNGPCFTSTKLSEFLKKYGVKQKHTTTYRPQSNGMAEKSVGLLKKSIQMFIVNNPFEDWPKYLDFALAKINLTKKTRTSMSPYFLLFKQEPNWPNKVDMAEDLSLSPTEITREQLKKQLEDIILENMEESRDEIKARYDKGTRDPDLRVGQQVFLRNTAQRVGSTKIATLPFKGPFEITDIKSSTVTIKNLENGAITKTHADRLKVPKTEHNEELRGRIEKKIEKPSNTGNSNTKSDEVELKKTEQKSESSPVVTEDKPASSVETVNAGKTVKPLKSCIKTNFRWKKNVIFWDELEDYTPDEETENEQKRRSEKSKYNLRNLNKRDYNYK